MSPFVYRLEKVLSYRKNKKEEQLQRVIKAQNEVARIQNEIDKTKATIATLRQNMFSSPHTMLQNYDSYIKHLNEMIDQLEMEKLEAIKRLEEEKRILEELEKSIKALEKHREKKLEEYEEEVKKQEMKVLDEIGAQKHFAKMLERNEDEALEELMKEYE
jgi:flagellar FliJ protein